MLKNLVEGHESVIRTARSVFAAAEKGSDQAAMDLLTRRPDVHGKTAWMLRAILS
jgi:starvation-inducible DNA-binding protein